VRIEKFTNDTGPGDECAFEGFQGVNEGEANAPCGGVGGEVSDEGFGGGDEGGEVLEEKWGGGFESLDKEETKKIIN